MAVLTSKLQHLPADRPIKLRNLTCPYCGAYLHKGMATKEHVIGRKFVPKGTLEKSWNLLLYACRPCNNEKADLENDISAITMQPDSFGNHPGDHLQLIADAQRKGRSASSRYTGKPVADSRSKLEFTLPIFAGVNVTFNFSGHAQISEERAFRLARMQFEAFIYLLTYNEGQARGLACGGTFAPSPVSYRGDWGNPVSRSFAEKTLDWDTKLLAVTADEHFKVAIRSHQSTAMWSFAVEWNCNLRITALCGSPELIKDFANELPILIFDTVHEQKGEFLRVRTETSLDPADDLLFAMPIEGRPSAV